jgi:hypothetical protein
MAIIIERDLDKLGITRQNLGQVYSSINGRINFDTFAVT